MRNYLNNIFNNGDVKYQKCERHGNVNSSNPIGGGVIEVDCSDNNISRIYFVGCFTQNEIDAIIQELKDLFCQSGYCNYGGYVGGFQTYNTIQRCSNLVNSLLN